LVLFLNYLYFQSGFYVTPLSSWQKYHLLQN
jgi:hypothetical protein